MIVLSLARLPVANHRLKGCAASAMTVSILKANHIDDCRSVKVLRRTSGIEGYGKMREQRAGFEEGGGGATHQNGLLFAVIMPCFVHPRCIRLVYHYPRRSKRPGSVPNRPALSVLLLLPRRISYSPDPDQYHYDRDQKPQVNSLLEDR
jgi:hypothetical protein